MSSDRRLNKKTTRARGSRKNKVSKWSTADPKLLQRLTVEMKDEIQLKVSQLKNQYEIPPVIAFYAGCFNGRNIVMTPAQESAIYTAVRYFYVRNGRGPKPKSNDPDYLIKLAADLVQHYYYPSTDLDGNTVISHPNLDCEALVDENNNLKVDVLLAQLANIGKKAESMPNAPQDPYQINGASPAMSQGSPLTGDAFSTSSDSQLDQPSPTMFQGAYMGLQEVPASLKRPRSASGIPNSTAKRFKLNNGVASDVLVHEQGRNVPTVEDILWGSSSDALRQPLRDARSSSHVSGVNPAQSPQVPKIRFYVANQTVPGNMNHVQQAEIFVAASTHGVDAQMQQDAEWIRSQVNAQKPNIDTTALAAQAYQTTQQEHDFAFDFNHDLFSSESPKQLLSEQEIDLSEDFPSFDAQEQSI